MDVLDQVAAAVGIGLIGARQPLERGPVFGRRVRIAFILDAAVPLSGPRLLVSR